MTSRVFPYELSSCPFLEDTHNMCCRGVNLIAIMSYFYTTLGRAEAHKADLVTLDAWKLDITRLLN